MSLCVDTLATAYRQTSFPHLLRQLGKHLTPSQIEWVKKGRKFATRQVVDYVNGSAPRMLGSDAERVDQLRHLVANDWAPWNVDMSVHVGLGAANRTQSGTGISQPNQVFPYMYAYGQDYNHQGF